MSRPAYSPLLAGILLFLAACTAPQQHSDAAGRAPVLYVGNGLDDTVNRLDASSGTPLGLALPAGVAPHRIVPAPGGNMLVLSAGALDRRLTHVAPTGYRHAARSVSLEPGVSGAKLAGDDHGRAVVAYHVPAPAPGESGGAGDPDGRGRTCRLALLDGLGAYGLAQPAADRIVHLDLVTGRARLAATLPARGAGLAVTAQRVYVPDPAGNVVWTLDHRAGALAPPIPVGRRPIGVALSGVS